MQTTLNDTALVVGGSGMLAACCKELAKRYKHIGVMGRTEAKMQDLLDAANIVPLHVDYADLQALEDALATFVAEYGQPSLIIAWIHSTAPKAAPLIAKYTDGDFYEITGHSGTQPSHISHQHEHAIKKLGLQYHRIILGRMGERWLTNPEISQGVLKAVSANRREYVVGEL